MKVLHISFSDSQGGAAKAAHRIHRALLASGLSSRMWVAHSTSTDWTVSKVSSSFDLVLDLWRRLMARVLNSLAKVTPGIISSPAALNSRLVRQINESSADVVHLHWVHGEMLSVADIGSIKKPVIWTLHDMWAFSGSQHYAQDFRWVEGYTKGNRALSASGFDIDRWVWSRKRRKWGPMHVVTPSKWLATSVKGSELMREWPCTVIPNALDTDLWRPVDKAQSRQLLGLPKDAELIIFGAAGDDEDPRKGLDLLKAATLHIQERVNRNRDVHLVILGRLPPEHAENFGLRVHYLGKLSDELSLRCAYSAADVTVIPSRQDNLPNMGAESLSCGTPLVAFDTGGLSDLVHHRKSGYLSKAFEPESLADGMLWVLDQTRAGSSSVPEYSRQLAIESFSFAHVAAKYRASYQSALVARAEPNKPGRPRKSARSSFLPG